VIVSRPGVRHLIGHGAGWPLAGVLQAVKAAGCAGQVQVAVGARARRRIPVICGLARPHASIEGNTLAACCRLGPAADPRVGQLAASPGHLAVA
jgi:hypothetical protein